ncbi:hypothetical protein GGS23DRAFT_421577 [Durotheca rogersii]|uniref:uncharacterized protein n=1 Tax=Durotheca rogersii TaxID=419775 RepID=UPI00221F95C8|nr:uncharacterized protein GGS23DRAFT_421577 [Durotheca rogersii]KAI5865316.1 hypothetical protein GGS23DRAFT_421577 [Durotheca rogersii]
MCICLAYYRRGQGFGTETRVYAKRETLPNLRYTYITIYIHIKTYSSITYIYVFLTCSRWSGTLRDRTAALYTTTRVFLAKQLRDGLDRKRVALFVFFSLFSLLFSLLFFPRPSLFFSFCPTFLRVIKSAPPNPLPSRYPSRSPFPLSLPTPNAKFTMRGLFRIVATSPVFPMRRFEHPQPTARTTWRGQ